MNTSNDINKLIYTPGTRIFYTGDMANSEDYGVIISYTPPGKWSDNIKVRLDDGRIFNISSPSFSPGPGRRFWLADDWDTDKQKRINAFINRTRS